MRIFYVLLVLALLAPAGEAGAQMYRDELRESFLTVRRTFGGYKISDDRSDLSKKEVRALMAFNDKALRYIKKANTYRAVGAGVSGLGLIIVGVALGEGDDIDTPVLWGVAGFGAAVALAGIPIMRLSHNPARKAADLYNEHLMKNSIYSQPKAELKLELKPSGIGLVLRF